MYKLFTIILFGVIGFAYAESSNKPNIIVEKRASNFTNLKVEGSLASSSPLSCVALDKIDNSVTPPDIFSGIAKCVEKGKFEKAGQLLYMARLYGIFDAKRVADKTAGQGITVLQMNTFSRVDKNKALKFQEYVNNVGTKENILASVCNHAEKIGYPAYHPKYMILHGIKAFTGIKGNGLDPSFDAAKTWQSMLNKNCQNRS
jgi:hypothetical protein